LEVIDIKETKINIIKEANQLMSTTCGEVYVNEVPRKDPKGQFPRKDPRNPLLNVANVVQKKWPADTEHQDLKINIIKEAKPKTCGEVNVNEEANLVPKNLLLKNPNALPQKNQNEEVKNIKPEEKNIEKVLNTIKLTKWEGPENEKDLNQVKQEKPK